MSWIKKYRLYQLEGDIQPGWEAFKITLLYILLGVLWILWSDQLLSILVDDHETYLRLQTFKGWFYVFVSGMIFYMILQGRLRAIAKAQFRITDTMHELTEKNIALIETENELNVRNVLLEDKIQELQVATNRYQLAIEGSHDALWEYDAATHTYRISAQWMKQMGYDFEFADSETWLSLVDVPFRQVVKDAFVDYFYRNRKTLSVEYRFKKANGESIWLYTRGSAQWDNHGRLIRAAGSHTDMSEFHRLHDQVYQQAYFDTLTQLPNRMHFENLVRTQIEGLQENQSIALVCFDLDDFKFVNELLGHAVGDNLLMLIAQRILSDLESSVTFAKISGDGFALTMQQNKDELRHVVKRVEQLTALLRQPFDVMDQSLFISVSTGVAVYPKDANNFDDLLKNADAAMILAKERGKNNYQFFTEEIHLNRIKKIQMIHHLHRAIEKHEMSLVYQPIFAMDSMEVVSLEALVRWNSAQFGSVSPQVFIPYAEGTGLIQSLEEWIFDSAYRQVVTWRNEKQNNVTVSINLSTKGLMNPDFILYIEKIHALYDIQPNEVQIEITETSMLTNVELAIRHMRRLTSLNISIALDDFGTGFSSLAYLQQLPIAILKIDRSFIARVLHPSQQEPVLNAVIDLGLKLNLKVVAEGVETENQKNFLLMHHCTLGQGFYMSKPVQLEEVEKLLNQSVKVMI